MSNMLPLSLEQLAEHITAKQDEYQQLEPCGYMLDWFAQQYYQCWQQTNTDASLELWGHMGGQLATEWVRQYSEVRITATDDEDICKADYLSDIYIVQACPSSLKYDESLKKIQNHVKARQHAVTPYLLFINQAGLYGNDGNRKVSIDRLVSQEIQWYEICGVDARVISIGACPS